MNGRPTNHLVASTPSLMPWGLSLSLIMPRERFFKD